MLNKELNPAGQTSETILYNGPPIKTFKDDNYLRLPRSCRTRPKGTPISRKDPN